MLTLRDRLRHSLDSWHPIERDDANIEDILDDLEGAVKDWLMDGAKSFHGKD